MQEAKDLLEVQKAKGPIKFENHFFQWGLPWETIQRVIEQDVGMHDVFVGVEHRKGARDNIDSGGVLRLLITWFRVAK